MATFLRSRATRVFFPAVLVAGTIVGLMPATAQETKEERFTANARLTGNMATGASARVDLTITRWTTPEERERLLRTLVEQGTDAALDLLSDQEATGRVRVGTRLGYDLRYAWETEVDGQRRIVLATDRPMAFWEVFSMRRTVDYNFSLIELRLDDQGRGEGVAAVGVKISFDPESRQLVLEHYDTQPVRLSQVRKTR